MTGLVDCGEGGNVFGVQFIKISLDGKELLHRKFDNFSYDQNHECPYVYDYHKSNPRGTGYVYNLFKWPFETLPISAEFGSWAGVIGEQSPGLHHLEILCEDFGGNKVVANGEVYLEPQKKLAKPFTGNISCKKVEFNTFSVVAIGEISQNLGKADFDGVSCRDGNGVEHVLPAKISGRNVQVAFPIAEIWKDGAMSGPNAGERCPSQVLPKLAFVPSAGGELKENSVGVTAVFPKGSLHFPILGQILPVHGIQGTKKLPAKSAGYAIQPSNFVTGKALKLEIPFASHSKPQRLGIYAGVSPNFSYQGGEVHDSKLVLECRALKKGAFVIMEDNIPPVLQFKGSRTIKHLGPVWVFSVSDLGEGISDEKFLPVVDGKTADWDFDPDHDELYIVKPVGKSGHSVTISAFDQAGNKAVFTRKL
ncbi:hypothetical protein HYY75_10115 [bacterium]|nr:hypothetical protein [bacterium]